MTLSLQQTSGERRLKTTTSRCPSCLTPIEAEIIERGGSVFMQKRCPEHGAFEVRLARDARFYHVSARSASGTSSFATRRGCSVR